MKKKYQKLLSYTYSLKFELFKGNIISNSELVPLKDLINYSSSNPSLNKLEKNNGSFPLYGADGIVKNIDFYDKDEEYIPIVKDGYGVGRLNFNNKKTYVV